MLKKEDIHIESLGERIKPADGVPVTDPELIEMLNACLKERERPKLLLPNQQKLRDVQEVYEGLENLLIAEGCDYNIEILPQHKVFYKSIVIEINTDGCFGIPPIRFHEYKKIINKIGSISHTLLTDGRLKMSFCIENVYTEITPDPAKAYETQ